MPSTDGFVSYANPHLNIEDLEVEITNSEDWPIMVKSSGTTLFLNSALAEKLIEVLQDALETEALKIEPFEWEEIDADA